MAHEINSDDVKSIKALITSLNNIFKTFDEKLDRILGVVNDANNAADAAQAMAAENKKSIDEITEKVEYLSDVMIEENVKLKQKITHLENYSRRDNLTIRGIPETKDEICEAVVKRFCKEKLKLDTAFIDSIRIVRCHRLGERPQGNAKWTRPIIVRFYNFGDRQQVWSARSKLAGTSFGVAETLLAKQSITERSYTLSSRQPKKCRNMKIKCTCTRIL